MPDAERYKRDKERPSVLTDEQRSEVDGKLGATAATPPPSPDGGPSGAEPKHRKPGLFKPRPERKPRPPVVLSKADTSEGLALAYDFVGSVIADREEHKGQLGSVGRSMKMTAPTAGRLLAEGAKRFPGLHNFLAAILGTGASVKDASAVIGIPILVRRMERDPASIPGTLPLLRVQMRPILRDMLKAAKEEEKVRKELADLERELTTSTGRPFTVDHLILMDMLGLSREAADEIIKGTPINEVLGRYYPRAAPEPEGEAEPVAM